MNDAAWLEVNEPQTVANYLERKPNKIQTKGLRMTTVYLAGPMRGIELYNFPAFDAAAAKLREQGYTVISPADLDRQSGFDPTTLPADWNWKTLPEHFSLDAAIERDIDAIKRSDELCLLPGWKNSKGANAEKAMAEWRGLKVWELVPEPQDGQTVVNAAGGKQSFIAARFDCIPPECLRLLAECLGFGARKYGKENWRQIDFDDNLAHAMNHLNEWRAGDRTEPHLVNALARTTFALSQAVRSGAQPERYVHPDMVKS